MTKSIRIQHVSQEDMSKSINIQHVSQEDISFVLGGRQAKNQEGHTKTLTWTQNVTSTLTYPRKHGIYFRF